MKALLLPVLLAALALPAAAQDDKDKTDSIGGDTSELKKRFKNQNPGLGAGAGEEALKAGGGPVGQAAPRGESDEIDDLEKMLIQNGWKKDAADNDKMSAELKKKHRILHRVDPAFGKEYTILVPKEVAEGRQLVYRSIFAHEDGSLRKPPFVLKRIRAAGHLIVIEFDQQQQYMSLNKPDAANGFAVVGFTHLETADNTPAARKFTDADAFLDALENQLKTDAEKASVGLKERIKTVSGGKYFVIEAYVARRGLVILILSGGQAHQLYPDPAAAPAAPGSDRPERGAPKEAKPR